MKAFVLNVRLAHLLKQRNIFVAISFLLLCTNLLQVFLLLCKDERLIVVPPDIRQEFWIQKNKVSASYLEEMAVFYADLILENTPSGAAFRRDIVLRHAATGTSKALDKYAEFFIKRAEQLQPVLQVAAGRFVDIVFTKSPTIAQLNAYLQQFSLASLLPYRSYDPSSHIFYNENSVGFVLEIPPLVGCTEEMQRELSGLFRHTLPEKSNLQFMLWADPKIGGLFERWVEARQDNEEIFKTLAKKRTTFLAQKIFNSEHIAPPRNMRCIISYTESGQSLTPVSREKLLQIQDQIKTALKSLGVAVYLWCAEDLLQTLDGILNIDHSINPCNLKWNSLDVLNKQILKPGNSLLVDKNALFLNEEFAIRTYSVRRAPDQWSLHAMGELIGDHMRDLLQIPCPFIIHYGVCISDQDKTKIRVQPRESWVERQAQSKIGKKIPILIKQSRELDFVRHQQSKGERFVQTYFSVSLFCAKNQLNQADQMLLNLFRSHRFDLQCDAYIQLPSLLSTLPMAWGEGITQDLTYLQKTKTTLSTEAANLLPLQGEWKGTSSSGMLLKGRRGQIFTFSPFDNNEGNYNVCVVGKSGSGKSVFMQDVVATTLGQGGQVFVLDCGRSFEKTVKLLHGEYIAFTPDANLCINPFSTIPCDNSHATKDALAMLKPIVSLMAAPKDGTNDLENAYLEKAITVAWEKKEQHASLSDVADYLKAQRDQLAKNLGYKLHPYAKGGVYSRFFNGPATVDLAAKMVVVELEELKERKDLQEVIVQMIILQITNKLYLGD